MQKMVMYITEAMGTLINLVTIMVSGGTFAEGGCMTDENDRSLCNVLILGHTFCEGVIHWILCCVGFGCIGWEVQCSGHIQVACAWNCISDNLSQHICLCVCDSGELSNRDGLCLGECAD